MKTLSMCAALLALSLVMIPAAQAVSEQPSANTCVQAVSMASEQIRVFGAEPQSQIVKDLLSTYSDLVAASNRHALEDVLKHYNPQFISGDNLKLDQIKAMIQETWQAYPDITYRSQPIEIRVNGDWATIEAIDHSTATAASDKNIINKPGKLTSESRSLLFLRRIGTSWEITSDSTIWEQAIIRYGIDEGVRIVLSAPEQVKAGDSYSATIQADIPEGTFSIATIDNQQLTYPHQKLDDKFRALSSESNELQRVMKANSSNHNEIVTATLGLTSLQQSNPERPSLSLDGIVTIVKRVNVVPISQEDVMEAMQKKGLVTTSASGVISTGSKLFSSEAESQSPELELAPSPEEQDGNVPKSDPADDHE